MTFCSIDALSVKVGTPDGQLFPLAEGVTRIECDFAQRTKVRSFVDGSATVPVSYRAKITVSFLRSTTDSAQNLLLSSAADSSKVAFTFSDGSFSESGTAIAVITRVTAGNLWGVEYTAELICG